MIRKNAKYLLIPAVCLYIYGKYNSRRKASNIQPSISLNNIFNNNENDTGKKYSKIELAKKNYESDVNERDDENEHAIIQKNILEINKNIFEFKEDRMKYTFIAKKNFTYKIMNNFRASNLKNIKIKLVSNKREFIYNLEDYHELKDGIDEFNFIMDNIIFEDNDEYELVFIYNKVIQKDNILFEKYNFNILETNTMPNSSGIFIIDINNLSYPYYLHTNEIMNVEELEVNDFSDFF